MPGSIEEGMQYCMCRSIIYHLYHLYSYINIVLNKYYIPHNLCLHQKGIHDQKRQWWIAYKISLCNGICKEPYVFFFVFFFPGVGVNDFERSFFFQPLFFTAAVVTNCWFEESTVWQNRIAHGLFVPVLNMKWNLCVARIYCLTT